jgi:hypothetical protein
MHYPRSERTMRTERRSFTPVTLQNRTGSSHKFRINAPTMYACSTCIRMYNVSFSGLLENHHGPPILHLWTHTPNIAMGYQLGDCCGPGGIAHALSAIWSWREIRSQSYWLEQAAAGRRGSEAHFNPLFFSFSGIHPEFQQRCPFLSILWRNSPEIGPT